MASNTSFAILPERVPSAMRFSSPARDAGLTFDSLTGRSASLSAAFRAPVCQLAHSFASTPAALTSASK